MAQQKLDFLATYTVEEFKEAHNNHAIEVKRQKNSDKIFFIYGSNKGETGPVTTKSTLAEIAKSPMISLCEGEITEQCPDGRFFMLHKAGEGAETIATF